MEDHIYILLAVGFVFFRILTSIKGNKTIDIPTSVDPSDWEGEKPYMGEEKENSYLEEEKRADSSETKSRIEQMLTMLGKPRTHQPNPTPKTIVTKPAMTKSTEISKSTSRHNNSIGYRLHSAQGARQAFIYSEIFKRKYE